MYMLKANQLDNLYDGRRLTNRASKGNTYPVALLAKPRLECGMTKALVTGAHGFIGSALCRRLLASRVEVHAVSRNPPADAQHTARGTIIQWWNADLIELDAARKFDSNHSAGHYVPLGEPCHRFAEPDMVLPIFENNFMTAFNLLMATAENIPGAGRIVLAGSFEEPDDVDSVPCSPYAAAKWSASGYARMFYALYQVPVVIAKIFMVYGPGQSDHTKLVPYVITSLLGGETPRLSSGLRLVDWIYVDDVVEGLIRCGQTPGIDGRTVELGSGEMLSIREVVRQLSNLVACTVEPHFGALPDRPFERDQESRYCGVLQTHRLAAFVCP